MRIFLPGDDPRVDCLKQIAIKSGHELTDSVGDADVVLCCQALLGPIFRDDTLRLLKRLGNQLVRPITFCLVSFESQYRLARRLLSLWRYNPAGQHRTLGT